jgi:hypothetical protein
MPLRFSKPHGRALCDPHTIEEESVAVSSSMLRGDSKTECLLEDVVEDGLDDDDPFFLVKRLVVFFHMIAALFSLI